LEELLRQNDALAKDLIGVIKVPQLFKDYRPWMHVLLMTLLERISFKNILQFIMNESASP